MMMRLEAVQEYLRGVSDNWHERPAVAQTELLAKLKSRAVSHGQEDEAKHLWCLEKVLGVQDLYVASFRQMQKGTFYEAWCSLDRADILLHHLLRHLDVPESLYRLDFIYQQTRRFQALYPFRWFASPEYLKKEVECSICGSKVLPRKSCGHEKGEIYAGEMCAHVVTKADFIGMSMVTQPSQKYSVLFLQSESGKRRDQYDYSVIEYLVEGLESPFDGWSYELVTRLAPHSDFSMVGRNQRCPCGSGKKYKHCCLQKPGVAMPHIQIEYEVSPRGLPELKIIQGTLPLIE